MIRRPRVAARGATIAALLVVAGCANPERGQFFIPFDAIEPAAGPFELGESVDDAPQAIMGAVITSDLLVGGQAATRMAEGTDVMPAAGEADLPADAGEADLPADADADAEVVRTAERQAAFARLTTEQREAGSRQLEQARQLEQWMRSRIEPVSMSRDDIRRVQELLAEGGFNPGPLDGFVGPRTEAAVRRFETAQELSVTGAVTQGLLDLLTILN